MAPRACARAPPQNSGFVDQYTANVALQFVTHNTLGTGGVFALTTINFNFNGELQAGRRGRWLYALCIALHDITPRYITHTVQYSTVQYSTVPCSTVQYSTLPCTLGKFQASAGAGSAAAQGGFVFKETVHEVVPLRDLYQARDETRAVCTRLLSRCVGGSVTLGSR